MQRSGRFTVIAVIQRVTDIFAKHDRGSRGLTPGRIIGSFQDIEVGNPALQAMERVHNGNGYLSTNASVVVRHDDFGHARSQFLWPNTKDVSQKVDTDERSIHCCFDDRCFRSLVIHVRNQDFATERLGQLLGGLPLPEIVDVLGGVRSAGV